jgi:nitrite reductase (NO-forming)
MFRTFDPCGEVIRWVLNSSIHSRDERAMSTVLLPPGSQRRVGRCRLAAALALALVGVGALSGCADDGNDTALAQAGAADAAAGAVVIDVALGDLWVKPASIDVAAGATVVLNVTNTGAMPHDLAVDGTGGTGLLQPGAIAQLTAGPFAGSTQAWCTVPGHKEAGMVLDIVVAGAAVAAASATAPAADLGAAIDFAATPEPDWQAFDPTLAPAPGGTENAVTFVANEVVMEVAPGVTQEMWVFNDAFPGPVLRGKVGDIFTVTLVNDGAIGHSVDFHASKVAWNDEMRTIQPGESLVYQFEAKHSGIWMYHCGTSPALHHIGNGMFGAIIIDPPDLAPVDHEFVFVQSEIYTGPMGAPGDLGKMIDEDWDAVVFNGYVSQYLHRPVRVEPRERVRAWVLDAGPNENSSFHIVGTIFDTVYKEGSMLLQPDDTQGGSQALDLQPAQGGYVEFSIDEVGLYPIVTHKFANVGKGALGLFQAGDVESTGAGH